MKEKCFETTRDMLREVQLPSIRKSRVLISRVCNERLKTGEGIDLKIAAVAIDRQLWSQNGEAFDKSSLFPQAANVEKRDHDMTVLLVASCFTVITFSLQSLQ